MSESLDQLAATATHTLATMSTTSSVNTHNPTASISSNVNSSVLSQTAPSVQPSTDTHTVTSVDDMSDSDSDISKLNNSSQQPLKRKSRIKNKQKHNESENRRRERMRERFEYLRDTVQCERRDRCGILTAAAHKIILLQQKLQQYEAQLNNAGVNIPATTTSNTTQSHPNSTAVQTRTLASSNTTVIDAGENIHLPITTLSSPLLTPIATAVLSLNGQFQDVNPAFCELIRSDRTTLLTSGSIFSVLSAGELVLVFHHMLELAAGRASTYTADKFIVTADQQYIQCTTVMTAIIDNALADKNGLTSPTSTQNTLKSEQKHDNTHSNGTTDTGKPELPRAPLPSIQQILLFFHPRQHRIVPTVQSYPYQQAMPHPSLAYNTQIPYPTPQQSLYPPSALQQLQSMQQPQLTYSPAMMTPPSLSQPVVNTTNSAQAESNVPKPTVARPVVQVNK